ncbi:uncharacterized protein F5Z01DRAFT_700742, partial [Emericellopsis atlantica]
MDPLQNADPSMYNRMVSAIVTGSNDALDVLSDAVRPSDVRSTTGTIDSQQPTASSILVVHSGNSSLGFIITRMSRPDEETLDLWDRSRFVRQGWFTAQEAITYIDLFYKYLAPLSPIMLNQFNDHAAHHRLVVEEAFLCCTILMISSRYFTLPGSGGSSRSHFVHNSLWHHCEHLLKKLVLGLEKKSTSRIRVVGTVEALILISDWQPRAVHFPPDSEGWDELLVSPGYDRRDRQLMTENEEPLLRWREDVFEPAKRANRMTWMILGTACNLAYEIGVLSPERPQAVDTSDPDEQRRRRAQKVLYAYVTQTATRLGLPGVFPESVSLAVARPMVDNRDGTGSPSWNSFLDLTLELTQLAHTATSLFFRSDAHLTSQIQGDHYADLLDHYLASLIRWQTKFNMKATEIHEPLRDSLLIEYHHLKACVSAVSIQAVVARASEAGLDTAAGAAGESLGAFITTRDARFLQDVINDSKRVLQIATATEYNKYFPYAPSRIKISVISASVFLLKALSVGSTTTDVQEGLHILDMCTFKLKQTPPDDMDFALRYASLVEKHTAQFRDNLTPSKMAHADIRMATQTPHFINTEPSMPMDGSIAYGNSVNLELGVDETWMGLPFNSGIAPFNYAHDQLSMGLDVDSLNFLWSLPDM